VVGTVTGMVGGLVLVGCSATPTATGRATSTTASTTTSTRPKPTTTTVPPTTTTTEQPGWVPFSAAYGRILVDGQSVTEPDGHAVRLVRFRAGRTRCDLHVGSSDPPTGAAAIGADSGASVGPDEAASFVGAFNGGFKASAGAGGFELNGQVLVPLQPGAASLVIDTSGVAHVGVWGQNLPVPGELVASVRQNLAPLVVAGQPSPTAGDIGAWGATLGGGAVVARSSVGQDAAGNLIFAGSMDAVPADLADALVGAGAVAGMELDINPEWVAVMTSPSPGAPPTVALPGQNRPANQYQVGWTRDFVTVLAVT
jgi:hypothetical protein